MFQFAEIKRLTQKKTNICNFFKIQLFATAYKGKDGVTARPILLAMSVLEGLSECCGSSGGFPSFEISEIAWPFSPEGRASQKVPPTHMATSAVVSQRPSFGGETNSRVSGV